MLTWTKPLDTIEHCLERIDTEEYAHDWDQHLKAAIFLAERRGQLGFDIEFSVPQGDDWLSRTKDPAWDRIIGLTEDRCRCGQHRTIVGGAKTSECVPDADLVQVTPDEPAYLVPRGAHHRQTAMLVGIIDDELLYKERPFSDAVNLSTLLSNHAFKLQGLKDWMDTKGDKMQMCLDQPDKSKWTLFIIEAVDPKTRIVTIRPNVIFSILRG